MLSPEFNGELIGSVPASKSVITTHATSTAPVTSDIPVTSDKPVTSFSCVGSADVAFYADPNDCMMFYHCNYGKVRHASCGPDQHFVITSDINTGYCTELGREQTCNV